MPFISQLKTNPTSYFFWSKLNQYPDIKIYLGTVTINNNSDYPLLIEQLMNDLLFKCQDTMVFMKLFHDLDDNQKNILHFILIIDPSQESIIKKTLLFAVSKINNIDHNIINYRDQINHYLEHIDLYHYQRIESYQI